MRVTANGLDVLRWVCNDLAIDMAEDQDGDEGNLHQLLLDVFTAAVNYYPTDPSNPVVAAVARFATRIREEMSD